jgi:hypothetical protein
LALRKWLAIAGASTKEIQEAAGHRTITMAAGTRISHPLTGCRWWSELPVYVPGTNMHRYRHELKFA